MNDKQKNALITRLANAAASAVAKSTLPVLRGPYRDPDGMLRFCDLDCWLSLPSPAGIPATAPGIYSPDAWKMLKAGIAAAPADIDPADLPPAPEIREQGDEVSGPYDTPAGFWEAVRAVLPAASTDETRRAIQGALIYAPEGEQPSLVAATDGHRAHVVEFGHDLPTQILGEPSSALFRAFQDAAGRDGEGVVMLQWSRTVEDVRSAYTLALWGEVSCIWKNTDLQPPMNIRQVFPRVKDTDEPHRIGAGALKALAIYAKAAGQKNTTEYNLVTCQARVCGNTVEPYAVPGALPLALRATRDKLTGAASVEGAPGFNARYLEEAAAFIGEPGGALGLRLVRLIRDNHFDAATLTEQERQAATVLQFGSPALMVRENRRAVVMPLRMG
jgi:hypothetical protein